MYIYIITVNYVISKLSRGMYKHPIGCQLIAGNCILEVGYCIMTCLYLFSNSSYVCI